MVRIWLAAIVAIGAGRIAFYYLIYEPISGRRGELVGSEFEPLRAFLNVSRVAYLSDEPIDADPSLPRRFDKGDMMYARASDSASPTPCTYEVAIGENNGNLDWPSARSSSRRPTAIGAQYSLTNRRASWPSRTRPALSSTNARSAPATASGSQKTDGGSGVPALSTSTWRA